MAENKATDPLTLKGNGIASKWFLSAVSIVLAASALYGVNDHRLMTLPTRHLRAFAGASKKFYSLR